MAIPEIDNNGWEFDDLLRMLNSLVDEPLGGDVGPARRLEVDHDQIPQLVVDGVGGVGTGGQAPPLSPSYSEQALLDRQLLGAFILIRHCFIVMVFESVTNS